MLDFAASLLRPTVDEADEIDAVLGMLQQLPCDQLADVSRADNQRVLHVQHASPAEEARNASTENDKRDRQRPEGGAAFEARRGDTREPTEDDKEPRARRDEADNAGEFISGCVV